jgi:hypothetical protein
MSDPIRQLITVVPPEMRPGRPTPTYGTQVLLPNGSKLSGVTRIELVAELNDLWRARIDCHVNVPRLPGLTLDSINQSKPLSWWRRLLLRAAGVRSMDITPMDEEAFKRYAKV